MLLKSYKETVGMVLVALAAAAMAVWLYKTALLPLASLGWDEGVHLLDALRVTLAVRSGAASEALKISSEQFFYPPAYSWIIALWSFIGGVGLESFRLWSLVAWVGSGILIYLLTIRLISPIGQIRPIGGFLAAGLFLTSPIYWIFGTQALLEMTGVLVTLMVAGAIMWADLTNRTNWPNTSRWKNIGRWFIVGAGVATLHFVKYNYAMWMLLGIGAEAALSTLIYGKRWVRKNLFGLLGALGIFGIFFFIWVVMPGRLPGYIHFFKDPNFYSYELIPFWKHLVWFFPMAILNDYLASLWLGLVLVAGIYCFWKVGIVRGVRVVRILGIAFLVNLFFATVHFHNQQSRYIITTVPFLYILGVAGVAEITKSPKLLRFPKLLKRGIGILGVLAAVFLVGRDLAWNVGHLWGIGEHLLSSPIYASSDYHDTQFDFDKENWPRGPRVNERPVDVLEWIVKNSDPNRPLEYFGRANEISPPALEYLRESKRDSLSGVSSKWNKYALTLEVASGSIIDTYDFRKMNMESTQRGEEAINRNSRWQKVSQKRFPQLGVNVTIWGSSQ